jgi:uncharacterized protein YdbL (DUF1318 family)
MNASICSRPACDTRPLAATARGIRAAAAVLALTLIAGCVTVNVYFPAAEAQRAADKIIEQVTGSTTASPPGTPAPQSKPPSSPQSQPPSSDAGFFGRTEAMLASAAGRTLATLVPAAQAAEPNLDISTPQIRDIIADMHQRFQRLKPYFAAGVVGVTAQGTIAVRDQSAVPLMQRAMLAQLVAQQNRDLSELYAQIADANGHPEWTADIRSAFAQRWIAHAKQAGWYYRNASGDWLK